jgi:broad specificity phosphatase PhoE
VIKAIVADAAGAHLDQFQRFVVGPASLSVVHYGERRPFVLRVNDTGADGESLRGMQQRAVDAVRSRDAEIGEAHGPDAVWAAVSHGDVIKSVVADALGLHLDEFQRIVVDPCSVTVIRYTPLRPFVVRVNDVGGDVSALVPPKRRRRAKRAAVSSDAVIGGGAGGA